MTTPDVVGEIVGFRAWTVEPSILRGPTLHSFSFDADWPRDGWMVATCDDGCTDPPGKGCHCGIYAARERSHLVSMGYHDEQSMWAWTHGRVIAIGEVGLAGKVIPGTKGWRAARARPLRLWVSYTEWRVAVSLAAAYGVPVGLTNKLREEPDGHRP